MVKVVKFCVHRDEIKSIHHSATVKAFNITTSMTMPYVCGLVMFATHYMLGGTLTASKIFTSLALLQAARLCVAEFLPLAVEFLSEAYVSCSRIQVGLLDRSIQRQSCIASKGRSKRDASLVIREWSL